MKPDTRTLEALRKDHREGALLQGAMIRAEQAQRTGQRAPISSAAPATPLPVDHSPGDTDPKLAELETFLNAVLPPAGPVYFAALRRRTGGMVHYPCHSVPQYAQRLLALDAGSCDVYFTPAAYQQEWITVRGKQKQRCQENVAALRACWLDLDVDAKKAAAGTAYATQADARGDLDRFIALLGIAPTFINSSGHGLHVFWAFREPVTRAQWQCAAEALKRACEIAFLRADPNCTADSARLLRPPGTLNRKDPATPLEDSAKPLSVDILKCGEPAEFEQFCAAVGRLAGSIAAAPAPAFSASSLAARMPGDNSALSAGLYEPHPYLRGLTREEQLTLICSMCAAIPDSEWAKYEVWALMAMPALRGLQWEDESPLLSILSRHTYERDRPTLAEKFHSFDGGAIGPLFELAERYGWRAAPVLAANSLSAHDVPYPDKAAAAGSLISRFIYIRALEMYLEKDTGLLVSPRALDDTEAACMPFVGGKVDPATGRLTGGTRLRATKVFNECTLKTWVEDRGYHPGKPLIYKSHEGRSLANSYKAPTYERLEPTDNERGLFNGYLLHMFPDLPENPAANLILDGFAWRLANPGGRLHYWTVLAGRRKGSGKSTLLDTIPRLLMGASNHRMVTRSEGDGRFIDYLRETQTASYEEMFEGDTRDAEERFNARSSWITGPFISGDLKGVRGAQWENVITFYGTSNYPERCVFIAEDDRRVLLVETKATELPEYLKEHFVAGFLNSPRAPGVLASLLAERDISEFNPCKRPMLTQAKKMARMTQQLNELQQEILAAYAECDPPFDRDFGPIIAVRSCLINRGIGRHALPGDTKLSSQMCKAFASVGAPCLKVATYARDTAGHRARYWTWRNTAVWKDASSAALMQHATATPVQPAAPVAPTQPIPPATPVAPPLPAAPETQAAEGDAGAEPDAAQPGEAAEPTGEAA